MAEEYASVNILVTGRVQGVFFRASTMEQAQLLNLTGWVKNLPDGAVEVMAEGPKYALEQLLDWCKQGPPSAEVKEVIPRWLGYHDEFKTFQIVH